MENSPGLLNSLTPPTLMVLASTTESTRGTTTLCQQPRTFTVPVTMEKAQVPFLGPTYTLAPMYHQAERSNVEYPVPLLHLHPQFGMLGYGSIQSFSPFQEMERYRPAYLTSKRLKQPPSVEPPQIRYLASDRDFKKYQADLSSGSLATTKRDPARGAGSTSSSHVLWKNPQQGSNKIPLDPFVLGSLDGFSFTHTHNDVGIDDDVGFDGDDVGFDGIEVGFDDDGVGFDDDVGFDGDCVGFDKNEVDFDGDGLGFDDDGVGFDDDDVDGVGFDGDGVGFDGDGVGFDGDGVGFDDDDVGFDDNDVGFDRDGVGFDDDDVGFDDNDVGFDRDGVGFDDNDVGFDENEVSFDGDGLGFDDDDDFDFDDDD
ncbi:hypothetical protein chiPu_0016999, partial [Chiloscyllium punctatum]|nr:hypothetical protein [Chiloscyllium punctatum]